MKSEQSSSPQAERASIDPIDFLREAERAWREGDAEAALAPYTEDAVLHYGEGLSRSGEELRDWPQRWFEYLTDEFKITKTFRAFSDDCLASEWQSEWTHPATGEQMIDRGAEFFFFRGDKVYLHHMFEHSWVAGEQAPPQWIAGPPNAADGKDA
jgi:nuclear transport factor 2 (NTF2) superfamily protein